MFLNIYKYSEIATLQPQFSHTSATNQLQLSHNCSNSATPQPQFAISEHLYILINILDPQKCLETFLNI